MTQTETLLKLARSFKQLRNRAFEGLAARHGMSQLEIDVLLFLHNNPSFDTAQSICELRGLSKSNVSTAVEQLCARGWLTRERDVENRRVVHLRIAPAAEPVVREAYAVQRRSGERVLSVFTPQELAQAEAITQKLHDHVALLLKEEER